jgi:hypothetical protein
LVTDLPADFEVFGQAVDSSMADLLGGTTGQVLAKNSNTNMDFVWVTQDDSNAIQNAIVDAKGDLITATAADTPARLAVGTNGQTLVADSTASTGLKWATPAGGGYWTSLASGSLSGSTLTLSSISGSYKDLRLIFRNLQITNDTEPALRLNNDSASNYTGLRFIGQASTPATYAANSQTQVGFTYNNVKNSTTTSVIFNLMDYANTSSYKIVTGNAYYVAAGGTNNEQTIIQSTWRSSSAINRIDLVLSTGTYSAGTYELLGGN